MADTFWTIGNGAEIEIIINRSRFIGRAFPIKDEVEVSLHLEDIRGKFPDASHHCYAYVLGRGNSVQRFNDDGEPGGTAGMPILKVILSREIEDALVVVTRYFGGVKLGAPGLVRAYSRSAAQVLKEAGKVEMALGNLGSFTIGYEFWGEMEYFLRQQGVHIRDIEYKENVTVKVMTWLEWGNFTDMIAKLTNGTGLCEFSGQEYYPRIE
ncbi:MAG: YigZ family protein [Clostridiales bacterium]|nr:YigZ family protein [Clostridiales bacterium]